MKRTFTIALAAVALGLGSFSAQAKTAKAAGKTLKVDAAASSLAWTGKKVTGQHDGTVRLKSGQVIVNNGAVTGGQFEVDMTTIKVADIKDDAMRAKLEGHLKSEDFFGVEKNPTATFVIATVTPARGAANSYDVAGQLTVKGITQPVSFPAVITVTGGKAEAKGQITIDRTKFDIRYGSGKFFQNLGDKVIYDDFTIDLHLIAG